MTNEELVTKIQTGENEKENMLQLWNQTKKFIHLLAARYTGYADLEDLEQEGFLSLYDAVSNYDPTSGRKFLGYAAYWMNNRMNRYLEKCGSIHIPSAVRGKIQEYKKYCQQFVLQYEREPTDMEAAFYLGLSVEQLESLKNALQTSNVVSIDGSVTDLDGNKDITVSDMIASGELLEENVIDSMQREQLKNELWQVVDELEQEQAAVIRLRFKENMTMQQAGEKIGCSKDKVRSIEAKGLRGLRKPHNISRLRAFLPEAARASAYRGSGVESFNHTWTSSTERVALDLVE